MMPATMMLVVTGRRLRKGMLLWMMMLMMMMLMTMIMMIVMRMMIVMMMMMMMLLLMMMMMMMDVCDAFLFGEGSAVSSWNNLWRPRSFGYSLTLAKPGAPRVSAAAHLASWMCEAYNHMFWLSRSL